MKIKMNLMRGWAGAGAWLIGSLAGAEDKPIYPADPAAHTVMVPFDASKPLQNQKAERYYLDYEAFQKLWELAKEVRQPVRHDPDATGAVAVNLAMHHVEVSEGRLAVHSRLQVGSRGAWQELPAQASIEGGAMAQWSLSGHPAPLRNGAILLEKPGAHEVTGEVSANLPQGWTGATLVLPQALASMLRVDVPLTEGMPTFGDAVNLSLVSEEVREGRRVFTFVLPKTGELRLQRELARREEDGSAPAVAELESFLTVRPTVEALNSTVRFRFPGAARKHFTVVMDADLRPLTWDAPGLKAVVLRTEGSRKFVDLVLGQPVRDGLKVSFDLARPVTAPPASRNTPYVSAVAGRVDRFLGLRGSSAVKTTVGSSAEAERRQEVAAASLGYWRLGGDSAIPYRVETAEAGTKGRFEAVYQVGADKLEVVAAVTLEEGRLPLREARVRLPKGFEVQMLEGAGVRAWQREETGIFVQFSPEAGNKTGFVFNAAQTRAGVPAGTPLPAVFVEGLSRQDALVLLATRDATDLRLASAPGWREVDAAATKSVFSVTAPWVVKRALVWEPPALTGEAAATLTNLPTVTMLPQSARFGADAVLLAQATDEGLLLSQQVGVQMDQGFLRELKLSLPATLPEARVRGQKVRDAQSKVNGENRDYVISFQGEIMTRAEVTLDWELPLDGALTLPLVKVEGAARARRFFIVDNASSSEVKMTASAVDETVGGALPYLPTALGQAQYFQGRGDAAEVKLGFRRTETTSGNVAIVTLAEITSALRPNGERWETVVYSLANRALQFLPVRLPEGSELITVMVGGERVRADWGERDGKALHLIPLIQMRPGELSQQVRLTYVVPASKKGGLHGRSALDDPELAGLSAERTLWNIWVPEKLEAAGFDGNMEAVIEDVYEDEKAQQKLSDATRLNRVASSAGISQADAQEALGNANRQLEELKEYQRRKSVELASAPEARMKSKSRLKKSKEMVEEETASKNKSNKEIEDQLRQQGLVLNENRITLREKPVFSTRAGSKGDQFFQGDVAINGWAANKSVQQSLEADSKLEGFGANTALNDNVAVTNGFFEMRADDAVATKDESRVTKKPESQVAANSGRANVYNNSGVVSSVTAGSMVLEPREPEDLNRGMGSGGVPQQSLTNPAGTPMSSPFDKQISASSAPAILSLSDARAPAPADPFAPAPSPEPGKKVEEVERHLQQGYTAYNLGDYQSAIARFQDVLRVDKYNSAARRGMENAEQKGAEYFDTARDHQRAKMLNAVNAGWEDQAPAELRAVQQLKPAGRLSLPVEVPLEGTVYHFRKLKDHARVELTISQPWEPGRTAALWTVVAGLLILGAGDWLRRKWQQRQESRMNGVRA